MAILALEDPTYQPAMRIITAITNAFPCEVTTSFAHDYLSGTIIRLVIPPGYGMVQANQKIGEIEVTSSTTFLLSLNTIYFDSFVIPTSFPEDFQHAQVIPVGQNNGTLLAATRNVLGG